MKTNWDAQANSVNFPAYGSFCFLLPAVKAEIRSEIVTYKISGQTFQGYLSSDDAAAGKRPGVLPV